MLLLAGVFIFATFSVEVQSDCANKTALYAVNATVHLQNDQTGYKANVTDLCENMVRNFPQLQVLSLINVNLSKIRPNAFLNVKNLRQLSLAVNHLTEIVKGAFNNLPSLEVLYLTSNLIERIETNAFAEMPKLKAVHLDWNKLVYIYGDVFAGSPRISLIDFRFNQIQHIGQASFQDIRPKTHKPVTIYLNKNQINKIDAQSFELPYPVILHLENNLLRDENILSNILTNVKPSSRIFLNKNEFVCVPEDIVVSMKNITKDLDIRENPLTCKCVDRIANIMGEEIHGSGQFHYSSSLNCEFPNAVFK